MCLWSLELNMTNKNENKCVHCHTIFLAYLVSKRRFCTKPCFDNFQKINAKTGCNSPRWKGGYENKLRYNRRRRVLKINAQGSHTLQEWLDLKASFDYTCLYCKRKEPEITLSEDHIVPLSKGGGDDLKNIQPLCRSCNSRKHNKEIRF